MKITSLCDIPAALFREFSMHEKPEQSGEFEKIGGSYSVSVCLAQEPPPSGRPYTLALKDYRSDDGSRREITFFVFPCSIQVKDFAPELGGYFSHPLLLVRFSVDDPPCSKSINRWAIDRGFWVNEYLTSQYGTRYGLDRETLVAGEHHWEFGFLMNIQNRAHELVRGVERQGHWQSEWNPQGNYSKSQYPVR
jgi:hypothetical protein